MREEGRAEGRTEISKQGASREDREIRDRLQFEANVSTTITQSQKQKRNLSALVLWPANDQVCQIHEVKLQTTVTARYSGRKLSTLKGCLH